LAEAVASYVTVFPLPAMFVIDVPDTIAPTSVVRCESAVTVQDEVPSRVSPVDFAALSALIAPVSVEPFASESSTELMPSAATSPVRVSPLAVSLATPPFAPQGST
jgi:hypothetical protein